MCALTWPHCIRNVDYFGAFMPVFEQRLNREEKALLLSLAATLIMSILGFGVGFYLNSQAILLDGIFSLFSAGMTGLSLLICHLIKREDDELFQFGYSHLEPLISIFNAIFILIICVTRLGRR